MSEQEAVEAVEAVDTALAGSEPEATAAPETEAATETPETQPEQAPKTFTQEELDEIVSKRLAREQRKWERQQREAAPAPKSQGEIPTPEQFESTDAYVEALAARKAEELLQQRELVRQREQLLESYTEREEEAREKYADFEQVAYNPKVPITSVMAEAIQASDVGPDIAYHLGSNPKDAARIAKLPPLLQAKEIGRIEAKLAAEPPVAQKKTTAAPAPISPVTARQSGAPSFDTTDPRSVKSMSTSEWIEAERQRQIRKWEASQRNR